MMPSRTTRKRTKYESHRQKGFLCEKSFLRRQNGSDIFPRGHCRWSDKFSFDKLVTEGIKISGINQIMEVISKKNESLAYRSF